MFDHFSLVFRCFIHGQHISPEMLRKGRLISTDIFWGDPRLGMISQKMYREAIKLIHHWYGAVVVAAQFGGFQLWLKLEAMT